MVAPNVRSIISRVYSFLWGACADAECGVWFGLEQRSQSPPKLAHWDGQQFRLISLIDKAHIQGESIHALAMDTQGNIWCGGLGLYFYDRANDLSHRYVRFDEVAPNAEVADLLVRPQRLQVFGPDHGLPVTGLTSIADSAKPERARPSPHRRSTS